MSLKIFATADVHLGIKFSNFPDNEQKLAMARLDSLERMVEKAKEVNSDLFIIAGDLFDRKTTSAETIEKAIDILSRFENFVLILPGNHDYYQTKDDRLWKKFLEIPDKFIILNEKRVFNLEDINTFIYPGPCHSRISNENAIDWIENAIKNKGAGYHIGIAHGSILNISQDDCMRYYPMTLDQLESINVDLWILGHTHKQYPEVYSKGGKTLVPGSPEVAFGKNFKHDGKAWSITIDNSKEIIAESILVGKYKIIENNYDLNKININDVLSQLSSLELSKSILKLAFNGRIPINEFEKIKDIENYLENVFYIETDTKNLKEEITKDNLSQYPPNSFQYVLLDRLIKEGDNLALQIAWDLLEGAKK